MNNYLQGNWRNSCCLLANLPGRSVATTSMSTMKLEHFDEIRNHGKSNFEKEVLEMVFWLLQELIIC